MIVFVAQAKNPITVYRRTHGAEFARDFLVMSYDELCSARSLPRAVYCFADLERLTDEQRDRAAAVRATVAARGDRTLNDPACTMRRYELLRTLYDGGRNQFGVWRVVGDSPPERFPVFLRGEHDHDGSRSTLLHTQGELEAAVLAAHAAGERPEDLLAVEFLDTRDAHGLYRKYGAFIVGDRILARHLFTSEQWEVKHADRVDDETLREELEFMRSNPHEDWLRETFRIANVDYGRIDYALLGTTPQTWEINTNPMLVGRITAFRSPDATSASARWAHRARTAAKPALRRVPGYTAARDRFADRKPGRRAEVNEHFARELRAAWQALG